MRFIFGLVGIAVLFQMVKDLVLFLYNLVCGRTRDVASIYGTHSYAVVTGGSEGIGLALAKQLAKRGFNLVLVARSKDKLSAAKYELRAEFPRTRVLTVSFDFCTIDQKSTWELDKAWGIDFSRIDVSVLVNNVGVGLPLGLLSSAEADLCNLIKVNCVAQTVLTTYFARLFRKRKGKSAVLNVGSLAGSNFFPEKSLYGASKLFNLTLGEAQGNFDPQIDYYCFTPGFVTTRLTKYAKGLTVVDADSSADFAMRNFGSSRFVFAGHPIHEVLGFFISRVPSCLMGLGMRVKRMLKRAN